MRIVESNLWDSGQHVLLGKFWPIYDKKFEQRKRDVRVDAIVKIIARAGCSENMAKVQVMWVAANAAPRHELRVDKVLTVHVGILAWPGFFFSDDKGIMLRKLAGVDAQSCA